MNAQNVLIAATTLALGVAHASADITTTISGTHTGAVVSPTNGNYRPFKIDNTTLFASPTDDAPVVVTGSVDLADLPGNSSVFVGLIAKDRYDAWANAGYDPDDSTTDFFGFLETAYGVFNTSQDTRIGLGQRVGTDIAQGYAANQLGTTLIENFTLTFRENDFSIELGVNSRTQGYVDHANYLAGGTIPTDFANGAYAFIGVWFDKATASPQFDVTFSQVPEPASLGLLAAGGLMLVKRRRRA